MHRKILYRAGIALAVLVLLVAAGAYLRANLARIAAPRVSNLLNRDVRIGAIELNLLRQVRIYDVHVSSRDGAFLASFDRAVADYNLGDLFRHRFVLYGLRVEGLRADVERYADGTMNLPFLDSVRTAPDTPPDTGGFAFILKAVDLKDADVTYRDTAAAGLAVRLRQSRVALRLAPDDAFGITIDAPAGSIAVADMPLPVFAVAVRCTVGGAGLIIDTLALRTGGMRLGVGGRMDFADTTVPVHARVTVAGRPRTLPAAVTAAVPREARLPDSVLIGITARGPVAGPQLTATLGAYGAGWDGIAVPSVEVRGGWEPGWVRLERLAATVWNGSVTVTGTLRDTVRGPVWSAEVAAARIDVRRMLRSLTGTAGVYDGRTSLQGQFGGIGFAPGNIRGRLEAAVRQVRLKGRALDDMTLLADVQDGQLGVGVFLPFAEIDAVVPVGAGAPGGPFTVAVHDLGPVAAFAGTSFAGPGRVAGRLTVAGSIASHNGTMAVSGTAVARDLRFQGIPLDSVQAHFSAAGTDWEVTDAAWGGSVTAAQLAPFTGPGLRGTVRHTGTAAGGPDGWNATVDAQLDSPAYDAYAFRSGVLRATLAGDSAAVHTLELHRGDAFVRVRGGVSLGRLAGTASLTFGRYGAAAGSLHTVFGIQEPLFVTAELAGLDLSLVPEVVPGLPMVAGSADLRVDAHGPLDDPAVTMALRVRSLVYDNGIYMDSVAVDAAVNDGRVVLSRLDAGGTDGIIRASGTVMLQRRTGQAPVVDADGTWQGEADVKVPALGAFAAFLPESLQAAGALQAAVRLGGTPRTPVLDGTAAVTEGRLAFGSAPPLEALELQTSLAGTTVSVDSLSFRVGSIPADLRGTLAYGGGPLHADLVLRAHNGAAGTGTAAVSATVDTARIRDAALRISGLDLAVLAPFTGPAAVAGRADMDVRAVGPFTDPRVDGSFTLHGLDVRMDAAGVVFTDGGLNIRFDRYAAVLDSLYGTLNQGRIRAGGRISWKGDGPVTGSLELAAADVGYAVPDMAAVQVDSLQVRYEHGPEPSLRADAVMGKTRITPRLGMPQVLELLKSSERPPDDPDPLLAALQLNVRLRLGDDLWVDNNLARLRVGGDLTVTGTALRPSVAGRATAGEGYVLYLDRKFTVERATADFIDPARINPVVDVAARCDLKPYQTASKKPYAVTLNVTGPADAARVDLASDPPLDKPDIVALLTLGRTRGSMSAGGDAGSAVLDRLQEYSSSKVAGYTERKIGNLLGLEEVSIQGDLFSFGNSWGPQLVASKKVTGRLEVTYSTTVGHSTDQNVKLRYKLTDRYALEGETDAQGRAGIDLKLRVPFK